MLLDMGITTRKQMCAKSGTKMSGDFIDIAGVTTCTCKFVYNLGKQRILDRVLHTKMVLNLLEAKVNPLTTSLQYFLAFLYSSHRERINRKQLQNMLLNYRFLAPFLAQRKIKIFTKKYCKDVDIRLTFTSYKLRKMFSAKNPIPNALRCSQVVENYGAH